jgi:hypothetical protein
MWRILNAENQILKYIQIFAAEKNQADLRNPCFYEKSGRFRESLCFTKIRRIYKIHALTKNQADLQNPCVYKKSGGFTESLRLQKIRQTIESLRALKSPRLVKNQRDWKSWRPAYCLGSAESPAADFLLVWLKSSRSDPCRCDVSLMQSPSEETAQAALLLWADSLPYLTGCVYRPPCQNPRGNQKLGDR